MRAGVLWGDVSRRSVWLGVGPFDKEPTSGGDVRLRTFAQELRFYSTSLSYSASLSTGTRLASQLSASVPAATKAMQISSKTTGGSDSSPGTAGITRR